MKKSKIALVAACDRNNYGDILLPQIFQKYCDAKGINATYTYFALYESDLQDLGGNNVKHIGKIDHTYNMIVIAGGEVLSSRYVNMYLNLQSNPIKIFIISLVAKIRFKWADDYCKRKLHCTSVQPWLIQPQSPGQKMIYNSVGGGMLESMSADGTDMLKRVIRDSTFFSVRDRTTYNQLTVLGEQGKIKLIPDTAIIMSKLYSEDEILSKCSTKIVNQLSELNEYIVIQVNKRYGKDRIKQISDAIKSIIVSDVKVVLLPIGRVQGHEDDIPLKKIFRIVSDSRCVFVDAENIFDIMYTISHSIAYIGSSLHGAITAASFGIPHTAISDDAWKLKNYISTWQTSNIICLKNQKEIETYILSKEYERSINLLAIEMCIRIVEDYFDNLIQDIILEPGYKDE